ncbi:ATP-dependent helicase BRM [Sesamum angolense]|uniref:ATP-dependent helicase BRM n=1 Tax=Sesamum angolense TaxID=2727404 RepID=A0AAE1WPU0_9LAMI|nr:ATP-dependent helicase BRM [Sesamum angolense]
MQSSGPPPPGWSTAASATASTSSSSSAFDHQQQQQKQVRIFLSLTSFAFVLFSVAESNGVEPEQAAVANYPVLSERPVQSLHQQFLRRPEGSDALLAYQAGNFHGVLGGSNFTAATGSMQLPQNPRQFVDFSQQHVSPNIPDHGRNRGQVVEQQMLNPMQYAFQTGQQRSALGIPSQQQMKLGTVAPLGKDQDSVIPNIKMQQYVSARAANQSQTSSSKKSSECVAQGEKQAERNLSSASDSRPDPESNLPTLHGQAVSSTLMHGPLLQQNTVNMANNPITMTAQMQALQALALERNIDLSHPANANVIAQLIPLIQSRMFAQQKANGSSTGVSASFANHVTSSQVENESSPHGNSSSEVSGQSGSSKARLTVSPSTLGVTSRAALFNSSGNISVHGVDSPLPPRQHNLLGNGMSPLPQGQSSGNFNQGVDGSFVTTTSGAVDEASQIQHAREVNRPPPQSLTPPNDVNVGHPSTSQGGPLPQMRQPYVGFTKQQLHVLKAQILAFRRLKKEDRTLPRELLQAIVSPPLDMQIQLVTAPPVIVSNDRLAGENVDGHAKHIHSSEKGSQVVKLVSGVNNLKEEGLGDNVPAALAVTQSTTSTTKELRVPPGKGEQQSLDVSAKCDQEPETGTQKSPVRNEVSLERASSISQPKDAGSTRKYHGPLFDFPIFTRKNDTLGPSMMNNNNLILAYDIKDLLSEEDGEIRKRKREEKIEKIDKILAVNLERKRIRPDLVIRLQIESKTLQLAECQARLREEIEQQQVEIMSMPDRPYRKFVRLCERQRQELNRQSQANLKATRDRQLKSILQWRKKLLETHWAIRDARTARNRGVHKYHERMLREFSKRKDDDRNKRMEALKNNDVERYREMLLEQQTNVPGDAAERYAVLSSFLTQTEEYLHKLGSKITVAKNQQEFEEAANAAAAAARRRLIILEVETSTFCLEKQALLSFVATCESCVFNIIKCFLGNGSNNITKFSRKLMSSLLLSSHGLSEEEVRAAAACAREEVMIRNRFSEMNARKDSSSVNKYYNLAHAVSERVISQPSMLRAGTLREYQLVMALIAYLMEFKGNYGPHLIIVPNAVLVNWKNDLKELWSLLNLLLPEVFDNRKVFHDWFSQPFQKEGPTHNAEDDWLETEKKVITIHRLHQILEPFMLRRRVEDVEGSLPPKVSIVLKCRMSAIQSAIYDWIKSTGTLRVDPEDEQRKWRRLVFRRIDGMTSLEDRESAIVDFNSPDTDCFIFLLSIRAAGRGLNLQSADTVIIYDPDPNPKNEEQAVARAHRIGQTREDRYMGSIESLIRNNIQQYKIEMADEVINAGRFDQRTTHEERRLTLETLLHDEERYQETVHDVPSLHEVNRMIARSEAELELFDQMDEELDWVDEMRRYDQVPKWLRTSTQEVIATIAKSSKKPSKNALFGGAIGMDSSEAASETERRRGRPKGKTPIYTELDEGNEEYSEASFDDRNRYSVHEEGEIGEFEDDESTGEPRVNKHSLESQKIKRIVSPSVSSQKFGLLSALDGRSTSHSMKLADELEEGEIAVSGDSQMDHQQSGGWIQDCDEGEDEQVLQPKIKRKRSIRPRPRLTVERSEEKHNDKSSPRLGDPSQLPFQVDGTYGSQARDDRAHKFRGDSSSLNPCRNVSSVKNRRNVPLKKNSNTGEEHALKSGRVNYGSTPPDDAVEHARGTWDSKVMKRPKSNANKMSEVVQRKCKNVINKLQRRIDKEGHQIVPLLTELWRRCEKSSGVGGTGDNLLDLRKIDLGVDNYEYNGVMELVSDVQLMLKCSMQFYAFSYEHSQILIFEKPEIQYHSPVQLLHQPLVHHQQKLAGQSKSQKLVKNMDAENGPFQKPHSRVPFQTVDDTKVKSHISQKESRLSSSKSSRELSQADDTRPFTHPGDLVICKKKRKDREKSAAKSGNGLGGPVSPTGMGRFITGPGLIPGSKDRGSSQQSAIQRGWAAISPQQGNGSGSVGWANPVKRMRTDAGRRRPSHL